MKLRKIYDCRKRLTNRKANVPDIMLKTPRTHTKRSTRGAERDYAPQCTAYLYVVTAMQRILTRGDKVHVHVIVKSLRAINGGIL